MSQNKQDLNLKGPDSFQVKVAALVDNASKHAKSSAIATLVLVVVAVAIVGYTQWQQAEQEELAEKLAEVEEVFNDEIESFTNAQQASQDELDKLKLELQQKKSDSALEAKIAELEAKTKDAKPDHSASKEKFLAFYENHKSAAVGQYAALRYAALEIDAEQSEKVKSLLEELMPATKGRPLLDVQSRLMYLSILEDAGEYDKALEQITQIRDLKLAELEAQLLLMKARLEFFKEDKESARTTLNEILTDHASSQEAATAKSMLALL